MLRCVPESSKVQELCQFHLLKEISDVLRSRLRQRMRELGYFGEEPYRKEIIDMFNLVLGQKQEAETYWKSMSENCGCGIPSMKYSVLLKYGIYLHLTFFC